MYVDDTSSNGQSYHKNPELIKKMVGNVVNWTEKLGLYCIIDWHILKVENPNTN